MTMDFLYCAYLKDKIAIRMSEIIGVRQPKDEPGLSWIYTKSQTFLTDTPWKEIDRQLKKQKDG